MRSYIFKFFLQIDTSDDKMIGYCRFNSEKTFDDMYNFCKKLCSECGADYFNFSFEEEN